MAFIVAIVYARKFTILDMLYVVDMGRNRE